MVFAITVAARAAGGATGAWVTTGAAVTPPTPWVALGVLLLQAPTIAATARRPAATLINRLVDAGLFIWRTSGCWCCHQAFPPALRMGSPHDGRHVPRFRNRPDLGLMPPRAMVPINGG